MGHKVLIIDTSILCVWLKIPGKETCGPDNDRWNFDRVNNKIAEELKNNATFVLPLASIIETGNHIAQCRGDKYEFVHEFVKLIKNTAEEQSPWAAFTQQNSLWNKDGLIALAERWSETAIGGQSIGDAAIVDVARFYSEMPSTHVEILTGDSGLKAYEPILDQQIPRRRQ